jgi:hypothetical protein
MGEIVPRNYCELILGRLSLIAFVSDGNLLFCRTLTSQLSKWGKLQLFKWVAANAINASYHSKLEV